MQSNFNVVNARAYDILKNKKKKIRWVVARHKLIFCWTPFEADRTYIHFSKFKKNTVLKHT